jgi:hypothetical protein
MSRTNEPNDFRDAKPLAETRKRVLKALGRDSLSGPGISSRLYETPGETGEAADASRPHDESLLYPALHSLEASWTLQAIWVSDASATRRRTYRRRRFLPIPRGWTRRSQPHPREQ